MALLCFGVSASADRGVCSADIHGYRVVPNSIYEFFIGKEQACFFAFYAENVKKDFDAHGNGNSNDALWYGYYKSDKIPIELGRPDQSQPWVWQDVCDLDAVSFVDMNSDGLRDIAVIGVCRSSPRVYRRYFIFLRKESRYVLDERVLHSLFGHNSLTVKEVKFFMQTGRAPDDG